MVDHSWDNQAAELYEKGMSYAQIVSIVGHSRKTVSYHLRKMGYQSNLKYYRPIDPKLLAKYDYSFAEQAFHNIDTEEKAYWLGFLYADGSMDENKHQVSLSLKEADKAAVENFRHFLHLDAKPLHRKTKTMHGDIFTSYEFAANNRKLFDDLIACGCVPRKTFEICFPSTDIVPAHLRSHFVRGYFDGDGSVTHGGRGSSIISIEILGTESFLNEYQNWTGIPHKLYRFNHSSIKRSIYGGAAATCILDRLYENAHIYLKRKYEKYLELRRLAVMSSKRTARALVGKIGEGLTANTEVTSVA